jgi:hypothetical protein
MPRDSLPITHKLLNSLCNVGNNRASLSGTPCSPALAPIRKNMRVTIIIFIFTFLTIDTIACTCNERINKRRLIRNSDFAFIGIVTENVYKDEYEEFARKERGIQTDAKVKITKQMKGTTSTKNVIVISSLSGECDINLIPGKKYLIIGNYELKQHDSTFDPKLLPPDSLIQIDSTEIQIVVSQPKIKTLDEWFQELELTEKVIFTNVCMTFYIKEER